MPSVLVARNLERVKADRPELHQKLISAGLSENLAQVKMGLGQYMQKMGEKGDQ